MWPNKLSCIRVLRAHPYLVTYMYTDLSTTLRLHWDLFMQRIAPYCRDYTRHTLHTIFSSSSNRKREFVFTKNLLPHEKPKFNSHERVVLPRPIPRPSTSTPPTSINERIPVRRRKYSQRQRAADIKFPASATYTKAAEIE